MKGRVLAAVVLAIWTAAMVLAQPAGAQRRDDQPAPSARPTARPADAPEPRRGDDTDHRNTNNRDTDTSPRHSDSDADDADPDAPSDPDAEAASAEPEPPPPPLPTLDVATAPDSVIEINASGGLLDSAISIDVPADIEVKLSVTSATIPGEDNSIPLTLREDRPEAAKAAPQKDAAAAAQKGAAQLTLAASSDTRRRVWIHAQKIPRAARYQATLTVRTARIARHYQLLIDSQNPNPPLGLRATHVVREPTGTLTSETFLDCIAVDVRTKEKPVVVIERDPRSEPKTLIPTGAQVKAYFPKQEQEQDTLDLLGSSIECQEGLVVEVGPLPPGSYAAVVKINGQPLTLRYDVRRPRLLAFLLVLAGGLVAFGARAFSRYQRNIATNEQAINDAERKLAGRRYDVRWDEISAENILRKARGSNRAWFGDDVPAILAELDNIPQTRETLRNVIDAFETTPLPSEVSDDVEAAIEQVRKTSTTATAEQLDARIAALTAMAESGFRQLLLDWLQAQQQLLVGHSEEIRGILAEEDLTISKRRVGEALRSLDQALKDAWYLISNSTPEQPPQLDKNHLFMLELVVPTAEHMARWLRDGGGTSASDRAGEPDWISIRHLSLPEPETEAPQSLYIPGDPKVVLQGETPATSLQPLTFAIEGLEIPPDVNVLVEWQVGGDEVEAGMAATFVLADKASASRAVSAQLTASRPGTLPFFTPVLWFEQPIESLTTQSRREQQVAWVADTMFSIVGVLIAAGLASAVAWDQQFTDLADYAMLFSTGLGVDLGLGSSLTSNLVSSVTDRLRPSNQGGAR